MARPTKQTEPTKRSILAALKKGNTRKTSAALAGVSYNTFRAMTQDEAFREAVEQAEAHAQADALSVIQKAAKPHKAVTVKETPLIGLDGAPILNPMTGEPLVKRETTTKTEFEYRAAAWILERRFPDEWKERKSVDLSKLTNDQLLQLLEELEGESEGEAESGGETAGAGDSDSPEDD